MKVFILFLFSLPLFAQGNSLLDSTATVSGFGEIRYRAPLTPSIPPQGNTIERPIVLFHGIYGGVSHRTWRNLLPLLDAAGKRVYLMDLPGVGESDSPKRPYSIEDFDLFVERFLEEVVKERANIISESILSNSVLNVAANRPELVRRVITINPSGVYFLNEGPSAREQALYDRLYNDDEAATLFYKKSPVSQFASLFSGLWILR
ncbi:MAG: alpha/beta fold hydrolase [Bdellovibrionota bacterium]|nr:alpha/beta fold hydrolase [Bdellovibrionota bacterium]